MLLTLEASYCGNNASNTPQRNQLSLPEGPAKRRRTKRPALSNSVSLPLVTAEQNSNLQTMLETLIYIVHEINLEQVKLTTTINQLIKRVNQNELYLNQLNVNIEALHEQFQVGTTIGANKPRARRCCVLDEAVRFRTRARSDRGAEIIVVVLH